jgi:hypothetical protein
MGQAVEEGEAKRELGLAAAQGMVVGAARRLIQTME